MNTNRCRTCKKCFGSEHALQQHCDAKGHSMPHAFSESSSSSEEESRDAYVPYYPPFPGARGEWVLREEFPYEKSFGKFECLRCDNRWSSAHAWKEYEQGCQRCETETLPSWMWLNDSDQSDSSERDSDSDDDGPHDWARCAACRAGICRR